MSTTRDIIHGFAVAAQALANGSRDLRVSVPARGAATLLNMVAKLLDKRSQEEVAQVLRRILKEGATPIDDAELDAQEAAIIAELGGGPLDEGD